jgi:hypothetical protein
MDSSTATLFFIFQAGCLLTLVLSFIFWFRLRETPSGDLACLVVASVSAVFLFLSLQMLGRVACVGGVLAVPGIVVYFVFLGLRGTRQEQVQIRQWGRRHGYRIVTIERQMQTRSSGMVQGPNYRILARRIKDDTILVGLLYAGPWGIRVEWVPVPPKHLPHGHAAEVPKPPHEAPPPPSKK